MNSVEFTLLWTDDDGMFQLGARASSAAHAAYHEVYVYPEQLTAFANELREFPRDVRSEVVLESGSKDPKWYGYMRMRVFVLKATGKSALEFESEVRGEPPVRAESHFFVPGMPADFNRMGAELAVWLKEATEPMRIEWSNG